LDKEAQRVIDVDTPLVGVLAELSFAKRRGQYDIWITYTVFSDLSVVKSYRVGNEVYSWKKTLQGMLKELKAYASIGNIWKRLPCGLMHSLSLKIYNPVAIAIVPELSELVKVYTRLYELVEEAM
jgi:hypothetical protein